jgi:SAM-dependent methyltransferase
MTASAHSTPDDNEHSDHEVPGTVRLRSPDDLLVDLARQRSTATGAALRGIDSFIDRVRREPSASDRLVDLGCSWGTLGAYVAGRLGMTEVIGVDRVPRRLARAQSQGIRTIHADLATDLPLPISAGSASVVTSFGAIEHLPWFDDFLIECARVLEPRGWLMLSMPNLGSYLNRAALLAGYQPRDVEVARSSVPGILPLYRTPKQRSPVGHPHVATLRAMRALLVTVGFEVVAVRGFGPHGQGAQRLFDVVFNRFPSLSRRVLLLARKRGDAEAG